MLEAAADNNLAVCTLTPRTYKSSYDTSRVKQPCQAALHECCGWPISAHKVNAAVVWSLLTFTLDPRQYTCLPSCLAPAPSLSCQLGFLLLVSVIVGVQGTGLASHRSSGSEAAVRESIALTSEECQDIRCVPASRNAVWHAAVPCLKSKIMIRQVSKLQVLMLFKILPGMAYSPVHTAAKQHCLVLMT